MKIQLYNQLTKSKEEFIPIESGKVKVYTCGITVYDRCHLGHARAAVNFDVLCRVFRAFDYDVTYVRNYTDIEDKIIKRANLLNISAEELTDKMIEYLDKDFEALSISPPEHAPKATEHIPEMIAMIEKLIKNGYAYEKKGTVFFHVRQFKDYGKLSGKNIDDLVAGSRVEVNEDKEDVFDFVLWKAAKPGEPHWPSPWGEGRPGWHIECSAMCEKYFGPTFDIHTGGSDLIFPHHENELAQSECAHGKKFVNYWLHNGMVQLTGHKMSKSLGNFMTIEEMLNLYNPELIRFYLISTHYRQSFDYSAEGMVRSGEGLDRIYTALEKYEHHYGFSTEMTSPLDTEIQEFRERYFDALRDDLNTPHAISVLFEMTRKLNTVVVEQEALANQYYHSIQDLGRIIGILQETGTLWLKSPRIHVGKQDKGLSDEEIEDLLVQRKQARTDKNWALADQIRDQLKEASIEIEDGQGGTIWHRK